MYIDMYRAHESKQGNKEIMNYYTENNLTQLQLMSQFTNAISLRITRNSPQAMPTLTRQITSYNNIVLQNMAMPACQ